MVQESVLVTWDLRPMIFEIPSARVKVYLLFLLVVCIFTSIKLARIWRTAVPFSHRIATGNPTYRQLLRVSAASLEHWINFTYLVSGIFASTTVYQISDSLIGNEGTNVILAIASLIRRLSFTLTTGLLVALYAFLVRWHVSRRIQNLAIEN